jgi:hypothetical protein
MWESGKQLKESKRSHDEQMEATRILAAYHKRPESGVCEASVFFADRWLPLPTSAGAKHPITEGLHMNNLTLSRQSLYDDAQHPRKTSGRGSSRPWSEQRS